MFDPQRIKQRAQLIRPLLIPLILVGSLTALISGFNSTKLYTATSKGSTNYPTCLRPWNRSGFGWSSRPRL